MDFYHVSNYKMNPGDILDRSVNMKGNIEIEKAFARFYQDGLKTFYIHATEFIKNNNKEKKSSTEEIYKLIVEGFIEGYRTSNFFSCYSRIESIYLSDDYDWCEDFVKKQRPGATIYTVNINNATLEKYDYSYYSEAYDYIIIALNETNFAKARTQLRNAETSINDYYSKKYKSQADYEYLCPNGIATIKLVP